MNRAEKPLSFWLRDPWGVLWLSMLVTLGLALYAPRVRVDGSVESLLATGDPARAYHEEIEGVFGSDEVTRIGLFAEDVFAPTTLGKIDRLTRELRRIRGVRKVVSLTTVTGVERTAAGLRSGRLLRSLPGSPEEAGVFRRKMLEDPLYVGSVVSADGRATAIDVFYDPMSDTQFDELGIEGRVRAAAGRLEGPEETAIAGIPTLKVHGSLRMEEDIRRFSTIALGLVLVVLFLMFRSWRGVALPLIAVGIGVIWTNGLMVLVDQPITIGTLVLNPLLMAIGVAYAIHVMSRYVRELTPDGPVSEVVQRTFQHVALPVSIAALTTLAGLATLIPHPVATIHQLGLYSTFGITIIFLASLFVVPAILLLLPRPGRLPGRGWDDDRLGRSLEWLADVSVGRPWWVLGAAAALCALSVPGIARLKIETDYLGFFDPDSVVRVDNDRIASRLAGTHPLYVVVEGDGPGALTRPEALRGLRALQDFVDRQPGIDKSLSLADDLARAREAVAPDLGRTLPESHDEADQLLVLRDPAELERLVSRDASRANLLLYTRLSGSGEVADFVRRTETFARDHLPSGLRVRVTGTVVLLNRTSDTLAREQIFGLGKMIAVLFVAMSLLFRSPRVGLLSLVPNVTPILLLLGLMGWWGVHLNVATSMIAVIAIGIAVDDTVHYLSELFAGREQGMSTGAAARAAVRSVGRAIVFTSVALAAGFLVSCVSGFQPIRQFGALSAVTMMFALFADLVLTPAIATLAWKEAESADEGPLKQTGGFYG